MSLLMMATAWHAPVSGGVKLVLLALADHADDDGNCWPGVRGVAEKTGLTDRSIQNATRQLVEAGLLQVSPDYRADGSRTTNRYVLLLKEKSSPPHEKFSPPGEKSSPPPGENISPPGETVSPLPFGDSGNLEPVTEPSGERRGGVPPVPPTKPEELPFDEIVEPDIPEWLATLRETDHYPSDPKADRTLLAWAARVGASEYVLAATALSVKAKLVWHPPPKKCWAASGRTYANIRAVFQEWVRRELELGRNGRTASPHHGTAKNGYDPGNSVWRILRAQEAADRAAEGIPDGP